MTLRLALRSLLSRPVRSAVLASGFGFGIAVMTGLLGVGQVILEQARSTALSGGGDVVVVGAAGRIDSARFVLSSVLATPPLSEQVAVASPSLTNSIYLVQDDKLTLLEARGGIPSLERGLADGETAGIESWTDTPGDGAWTAPDPGQVLRAMDRFHSVPDVPGRADSWAEWLYFNGRKAGVEFYLSFLVGPATLPGRRAAVVRLQLARNGTRTTYSDTAEIDAASLLRSAPDLDIGASRVRLDGLVYRIDLSLFRERSRRFGGDGREGRRRLPALTGVLSLEAVPGRSLPPFVVRGARGWVSGYTVPVLSGRFQGRLVVDGETIGLDGTVGSHDHNWGVWDGVSWQWGQVAHEDLSFVYGRIHPPADVADTTRLPGFLGVVGPDGLLGFSDSAHIVESTPRGEQMPSRIAVRAHGQGLRIEMDLTVEETVVTPLRGMLSEGAEGDFVQMRAAYRVTGQVGDRKIDFTAPGAAETFRTR